MSQPSAQFNEPGGHSRAFAWAFCVPHLSLGHDACQQLPCTLGGADPFGRRRNHPQAADSTPSGPSTPAQPLN